jgi:tetratricopeptide (TPR) repeat protein
MQPRLIILATSASLLLMAPAHAMDGASSQSSATSKANQQAREREARRACLNGDYAEGVKLLSDLFLDFKSPDYIFNQGRCYEQNQRFEEAIGRFREYLRTTKEDRAPAEQHIAECEALLKKQTPSPAAAPIVEPAPQPPPGGTPHPVEREPVAELTQPSTAPASPGSGFRVAGAVIAGVGAASLITGLVLNLKANNLANGITAPDHSFDRNVESTRSTYESFAWVGYGVGAAALATGAILYGIGWSKSRGGTDVVLVPTIGPNLAGTAVRGAF